MHIKIKPLKDNKKNRSLWYYNYQDELFKVTMDTKAGFMVKREGINNKMWNVKHSHADVLSKDDEIV